MVSIHIEYEGDLRCRATHGPSSNELLTDAPVDNLGKGESFSPTDLVATALGTCMATTMGIAAQKRAWDVSGIHVDVVKHMVADPKRRIGKLEVSLRMPAREEGWDARARAVLEAAALECPVHASLRPEVEIPVTFDWG